MKFTLFACIGIFAMTAFAADNYTINQFSGEETGTPDQYIDAEFGGSLKISGSGTVENVQSGRFYVRQKFEDPFGETPTTYQLYEGREGTDKANLAAFTLPSGIAYGFVVKAKIYSSADADAAADIEKVYFDGNAIYAEGVTELYVHRGVKTIALVPENVPESSSSSSEWAESSSSEENLYAAAAPVEESSSSAAEDEYCDDDDPDCESEDDYAYDVEGDVSETANRAVEEDYAISDVTDRFGIADEVRKWSAWGLVGVAAASIGIGIYDQMQYSDAKDAHDKIDDKMSQHRDFMKAATNDEKEYQALLWYESQKTDPGSYGDLKKRNKKNKDTMDSYSTARNIWFGVAALSIAGSIVLFTW